MTTAVIHESMANYAVSSCANWFKECTKLTAVNGLPNLKTSSCQSYYNMFRSCKLLKTVDVSKLLTEWSYLTSSITINLGCMFYECESLATIDVSGWTQTVHVSNMAHMFWHCKAVKKLDLSKWKADNCTAMNSMFSGCENLTNLSFNSEFNFNTSKVTTMSYMFYNCKSLTSIPVTSLNTQSVKDMSHMFEGCQAWAASFWRIFALELGDGQRHHNGKNVLRLQEDIVAEPQQVEHRKRHHDVPYVLRLRGHQGEFLF